MIRTTTPETTYSYTYDCGNKVRSIQTDRNESAAYTYDGELLTSMTQSGTLNQSIDYRYNRDFRADAITYAGKTETLAYDKDGLPIRRGDAQIARDAKTGLASHIGDGGYSADNRYNGYGEPKEHNVTINGVPVYANAIEARNKNGQITRRTERVNSATHLYQYRYDDRGRLKRVLKDGNVTEVYTY